MHDCKISTFHYASDICLFVSFTISTVLLLHAMNNITLYINTCLLELSLYCILQ